MIIKHKVPVIIIITLILGFIIGFFVGRQKVEVAAETVLKERVPDHPEVMLSEKLNRDNPVDFLKQDLVKQSHLIDDNAVLGGTMGFYDVDNIRVLTDRWVVAPFEDGHIGGFMLLRYQIDDERNISWEVVASYLD